MNGFSDKLNAMTEQFLSEDLKTFQVLRMEQRPQPTPEIHWVWICQEIVTKELIEFSPRFRDTLRAVDMAGNEWDVDIIAIADRLGYVERTPAYKQVIEQRLAEQKRLSVLKWLCLFIGIGLMPFFGILSGLFGAAFLIIHVQGIKARSHLSVTRVIWDEDWLFLSLVQSKDYL